MVRIQYSLIRKFHPYHLVDPSPWPYLLATNMFLTAVGAALYLHTSFIYLLFLGLFLVSVILFCWFRDIIREGSYQGKYTIKVLRGLKYGFILFIVSEVFFFVSFFWAFFHSSLSPAIEIGVQWPPFGVEIINPFSIPLLNTALLLSSGFTVTWCHYEILNSERKKALYTLTLTIILGIVFTLLQLFEYITCPFSMSDSVYGSCFFICTGFHGFHVLVGTIFLTICLFRLNWYQFTSNRHFGFEAASWYWHFVDVIWIFLYLVIYWWGS